MRRASDRYGEVGTTKGKRARSVPLIDQAARPLDRLSRRESFTGPDDLVFPSVVGGHFNDDHTRAALYAALGRAGLGHLRARDRRPKPFRFHDLRHTFGTIGATIWPMVDLQAYMGHAHIATTMIYAHHVPKTAAAALGSAAVAAAMGEAAPRVPGVPVGVPT